LTSIHEKAIGSSHYAKLLNKSDEPWLPTPPSPKKEKKRSGGKKEDKRTNKKTLLLRCRLAWEGEVAISWKIVGNLVYNTKIQSQLRSQMVY